MEENKDVETLLQKNQLDPGIVTEEEMKFINGGFSVSETEGDVSNAESVSDPVLEL